MMGALRCHQAPSFTLECLAAHCGSPFGVAVPRARRPARVILMRDRPASTRRSAPLGRRAQRLG
jgi:hypothetical protein